MSSTLTVKSPYDGSTIGEVRLSTEQEIEAALIGAAELFRNRKTWLPTQERVGILRRASAIVSKRRLALARQAAQEGGKPIRDSLVEVDRAADGLLSCAEELRDSAGHVIPMGLNVTSANRIAFTQKEPIGVVVGISAFNHPFNLVAHQVGPAVAVGAPVIVKPALQTPLSCLAFLEIMYEAGLPREWARMVLPPSNELAARLAADARLGFVSFIGSAAVGWKLRANLAPGVRCALEHGGIAPVIVSEDADLDAAAKRLARAAFWHAGQACVSVQRIFCHERVAVEFADRLRDAATRLRVGEPLDETTDVGPLISSLACDRVDAWVQAAVSAGARLLCGGQRLSDTTYANTVLFEPPADAAVSTQEVFGPVVSVYSVASTQEAIDRANASRFAFQAAVFTRNLDTAMTCFQGLNGSAVMVNEHTLFRVDWMPFAGLRESGLGVGGMRYSMRDMQVEKMLVWRSQAIQ